MDLLEDPAALQSQTIRLLRDRCGCESLFKNDKCLKVMASSVMLLLGRRQVENKGNPEICIILNKRSKQVRQAGDLCCPGGTVETDLDPYIARLLTLPGSPLARWPHWSNFRCEQPYEARLMSLLLATSIRESWEEMRLNPFCTRFLGPLPSQCLILFRRVIHPMVCWVSRQKRFTPSWEVEKIVSIPLKLLLNPAHYALYRLHIPPHLEWRLRGGLVQDFPCFLYSHENRTEILWGVTYRIVTLFLETVFGFKPPPVAALPLVPGVLDDNYVYGINGKRPPVNR